MKCQNDNGLDKCWWMHFESYSANMALMLCLLAHLTGSVWHTLSEEIYSGY